MNLDQSKHTSCRFCNLLLSDSLNSPVDKILMESQNYFAISSIGGYIPGWTLIFSKIHKLNLSVDYTNSDFLNFVADVCDVVSSEYGSSVIFEHGSNTDESATSCGVSHAHLHVVPFSKDIESLATHETDDLLWQNTNISEIASLASSNEYLFCANSFDALSTNGKFSIITKPRSQFFRKVLAKAMGLSDMYDYKRYRFEEVSTASSNRLGKKLYTPASA